MPLDEHPDDRRRRLRRERQARWRARTAGGLLPEDDDSDDGARKRRGWGASVTIHLSDRECAVLDSLAAQLYRDHPHVPAEGLVEDPVVFPGRPGAVRLLIELYLDKNRVRRPASRTACAEFWRQECAFRMARAETSAAQQPTPPWAVRKR